MYKMHINLIQYIKTWKYDKFLIFDLILELLYKKRYNYVLLFDFLILKKNYDIKCVI